MGYRIVYGTKTEISYYPHIRRKKIISKKIGILAATIALILFLAGAMMRLKDRIPFEIFTSDLADGKSFANAITVFCRDIIENAKTLE